MRGVDGLVLERVVEVRARRAVFLDDLLRKQVRDPLSVLRLVGRENVIERAVFTHNHDHVLDGSGGLELTGQV